MLYLSTRNKADVYTAHSTLQNDYAPDGGQFVPYHFPESGKELIADLKDLSYGQTVAKIINLFFANSPAGIPVDFLARRNPLKFVSLNRQMLVAETWHNLQSDFSSTVSLLYKAIYPDAKPTKPATFWVNIAVRVAVLFGIYGAMLKAEHLREQDRFDVSVNAGDFTVPMACWYAKRMGIPIGTILCTGNEHSQLWDFVKHGQITAGTSADKTDYPLMDHPVPAGLESLLHQTLGMEEANAFADAVRLKKAYRLPEAVVNPMEAFYAAIVSTDRVESVIRSIYRTEGYFMDPYTAFSCAGLQDMRAKTGESGFTLLISEKSPLLFADVVSKSCGVTKESVVQKLKV